MFDRLKEVTRDCCSVRAGGSLAVGSAAGFTVGYCGGYALYRYCGWQENTPAYFGSAMTPIGAAAGKAILHYWDKSRLDADVPSETEMALITKNRQNKYGENAFITVYKQPGTNNEISINIDLVTRCVKSFIREVKGEMASVALDLSNDWRAHKGARWPSSDSRVNALIESINEKLNILQKYLTDFRKAEENGWQKQKTNDVIELSQTILYLKWELAKLGIFINEQTEKYKSQKVEQLTSRVKVVEVCLNGLGELLKKAPIPKMIGP